MRIRKIISNYFVKTLLVLNSDMVVYTWLTMDLFSVSLSLNMLQVDIEKMKGDFHIVFQCWLSFLDVVCCGTDMWYWYVKNKPVKDKDCVSAVSVYRTWFFRHYEALVTHNMASIFFTVATPQSAAKFCNHIKLRFMYVYEKIMDFMITWVRKVQELSLTAFMYFLETMFWISTSNYCHKLYRLELSDGLFHTAKIMYEFEWCSFIQQVMMYMYEFERNHFIQP